MEQLGRHGQRVKELRRRVRSRRDGEVIADGRRLVDDLLRWGVGLRELYLVPELAVSAAGERWAAAAAASWVLDAALLAELAPTRNPQGVLAVVEEPVWPQWPAREGVAVYLEGVQDPGNVGAIVRAAAALGAAAVLLAPGSADPFHPAAVRGSAGAVFRLSVEREQTASRAVDRLRQGRGEAWATGAGGLEVADWRPARPLLLMLGAEGPGLDPQSAALADGTVTIPLGRGIESLNVAVAAGVLLEQLRRGDRTSEPDSRVGDG